MKFVMKRCGLVIAILGLGVFAACAKGPEVTTNANSAATPTASSNSTPASTPAVSSSASPTQNSAKARSTDPQPQIGSGGNDLALFSMTRAALSSDAELSAANLIIEAKSGVVTLTGTVKSAALKTKAEQLVKAVEGVKQVNNRLRVGS